MPLKSIKSHVVIDPKINYIGINLFKEYVNNLVNKVNEAKEGEHFHIITF
jgi:tRNA G46 methylase TrmB